jgi:hypothetical protein
MFHAEEKRKAKGDLLRTPLWERRNKPVRKFHPLLKKRARI